MLWKRADQSSPWGLREICQQEWSWNTILKDRWESQAVQGDFWHYYVVQSSPRWRFLSFPGFETECSYDTERLALFSAEILHALDNSFSLPVSLSREWGTHLFSSKFFHTEECFSIFAWSNFNLCSQLLKLPHCYPVLFSLFYHLPKYYQ
jgi:hypothetical protein